MKKAVVLLSGGMDSAVVAAIASKEYNTYFMHIDYGQRTEKKEKEVFLKLVDFFNPEKYLIISMTHFKAIGGSALTDTRIEIPYGLSDEGIPPTYVPFRNANFLSAAVSWAEVVGATKIFIGATEEDAAGYPDCRKEFYDTFNLVIQKGTRQRDIEIITPVINMKKSEIVKLGTELNAPFHLTWSCYEREDYACGKCDSCLRRLRAFKEAGINDPILYYNEQRNKL